MFNGFVEAHHSPLVVSFYNWNRRPDTPRRGSLTRAAIIVPDRDKERVQDEAKTSRRGFQRAMAEAGSVSYAIEITDIEARGTRLSVTTPAGLQALFHDGDMIRGLVILDVGSIHHVRNIAIDLIGQAEASVQRTDSSGGGPKSFKNKEVFLWKSQTLAGTPNNDLASSSTLAPRSPLPSPALTTQGRIVQFNKGRHFLPFELTLETGCTPGSVRWQNQDMPSHATHNVIASIHYKLRYVPVHLFLSTLSTSTHASKAVHEPFSCDSPSRATTPVFEGVARGWNSFYTH